MNPKSLTFSFLGLGQDEQMLMLIFFWRTHDFHMDPTKDGFEKEFPQFPLKDGDYSCPRQFCWGILKFTQSLRNKKMIL